MNPRKKLLIAVFVPLGVAALICLGRWLWFYRGWYRAPEIPTVDESYLIAAPPRHQFVVDRPTAGNGRVVIDMAHANHLAINDLTPLLDRLAARGVQIQALDTISLSLASHLHGATAFLVIAPTKKFTPEEQEAVVEFVADGGRLLLVADPTRPVQETSEEDEDEWPSLYDIFFPTSAVPAINSLANRFGVHYFDDYLYNLENNAGNYRNVQFTNFARGHPLTQDIETLVFFASHSLVGDGIPLVIGDGQTRSSARTGETGLVPAMLSANGRVLALGDLTFLTPPYHTIGDNDRFLSHLADWLAVDSRQRDALDDFPYFFTRPVDMVQVSGDLLAPQLITLTSQLQDVFQQAGYTITMRAEVMPGHDALLLGLFNDTEAIQDYLVSAGVTITGAGEEVSVEALGDIGVKGTTLYLLDGAGVPGAERVTLIVLAEDYEALAAAVKQLASLDFASCAQAGTVTLCSIGEAQEDQEKK